MTHREKAAPAEPVGQADAIKKPPSAPLLSHTRFASVRLPGALRDIRNAGLGEALWLFLTLRLAFSAFALLASLRFQLPGPCTWEGGPALHTTGLAFRLLGVWQRWDACWYLKIATLGYRAGDPSVVFFPLYPRLVRLFGLPLNGNLTLSALVVSGLAYIVAMLGLYRLVERDFDSEVARRAALYLSIFPAAFFLFAPFSEALFLALAVWTLYTARAGAWAWAPLPAFWIGLTRTQGCLLAIPLAWEFIRQRRRAKGPDAQLPRPPLAAVLVPILPICSFAMYIAYTSVITGWTTFQAQGNWGFRTTAPWAAVAASWRHIIAQRDVVEGLNLLLLLLFTALLILGLARLPISYTVYAAPQLLLIAVRQTFFSPLMSTSRYTLVIFPAFVVLALLGRRPRLHYSWLILSLLLLGFLLHAFLSGIFVA